ncbi:MAG: type II toxin-antitoxin system HicB family antitoxin [Betaproteobacteria bacterium]|nr:type II toxin-antitoxin system HicB family antitoxin [Betaproteobacteria bacterium]
MATFYTAILERDAEGFSVYFPDVPGCTSAGSTAQEAADNAEAALYAHLEIGLEHGEKAPAARALDDIPIDPEAPEAARILVRYDPPEKAVRVNITLPEDLLRRIDAYAQSHGFTRSGLLAQAARKQMRFS